MAHVVGVHFKGDFGIGGDVEALMDGLQDAFQLVGGEQ